jgi:hypothetical protein
MMRSVLCRMTVLAIALLAGCATLPPCPAKGGPPWSEWTTPHFRLVTNLPDDDAETAAAGFEELRAALVLAAWRKAPAPRARLEVVVVRSPDELAVFLPQRSSGAFIGNPILGPLIVTHGGVALHSHRGLKHEIVHGLAYQMGASANHPRWLREGIPTPRPY